MTSRFQDNPWLTGLVVVLLAATAAIAIRAYNIYRGEHQQGEPNREHLRKSRHDRAVEGQVMRFKASLMRRLSLHN